MKVRVNRGFAFNAQIKVPTSWVHNSTLEAMSLDDAIAAAGHLGDAISKALREFAPAGESPMAM